MRKGLEKGKTPPQITMRDVPGQVTGRSSTDPMASPLLAAFKAFPAAVPAAERERLTSAATDGLHDRREAGVRAAARVPGEDVPARRVAKTIAASALPDGAAMYAYNVRWHTTTAADAAGDSRSSGSPR